MAAFDVQALFLALDAQRAARGLSWAGVAREFADRLARVDAGTIKGIADKGRIEGDGCLQMLLWLDRSPESFVAGALDTPACRLPLPEKGVLRFDMKTAHRLLVEKRVGAGLSWSEVASQIDGFSADSLRRFSKGGRTTFPAIINVTRWLDVPVRQITHVSPW